MSIAAINWATDLRLGKEHAIPKAVLCALANMAGPDGGLWALQDTLSDRLDMPERTLRKALGALRRWGLLTVERGQRGCRFLLHVGAQILRPAATSAEPVEPVEPEPVEPEPEAEPEPVEPEPEAEPEAPAEPEVPEPEAAPPVEIGTPCRLDRHPMPTRSAPHAAPSIDEPNRTQLNLKTPPSPPRGDGAAGQLIRFLDLYPRTGDRHATERAWNRALRRGANPGDIVDGLEIALVDGLLDPREAGRFAPPASQWLRGKRWLDFEEHARRQMAPYAAINAARAAQAAQAGR